MTARCLATFVLAFGLVLMHHTVMAGPPDVPMVMATPTGQQLAGPAAAGGAVQGEHSPAGHGEGHGGMLHLCLAVLAALGALLLVVLAFWSPRPSDDGDDAVLTRAAPAPARPPPVPLRLARLQVLRL